MKKLIVFLLMILILPMVFTQSLLITKIYTEPITPKADEMFNINIYVQNNKDTASCEYFLREGRETILTGKVKVETEKLYKIKDLLVNSGEYNLEFKCSENGFTDSVYYSFKTDKTNNTPLISSVSTSPPIINDGQFIKFEAFASDSDIDDKLNYFWDFGDNQTGEGKIVTHSFNLPKNSFDKNFAVRAIVRDSKGEESSLAQFITVKRSEMKIEIVEPKAGVEYPKNEDMPIKVIFKDKKGNTLTKFNVKNIEAKIDNKKIELKSNGNIFEGVYKASNTTGENALIVVEGSSSVHGSVYFSNAVREVKFKPLNLRMELTYDPLNPTRKTLIRSIFLKFFYPNNEVANQVRVSALLNNKEVHFSREFDTYVLRGLGIDLTSKEYILDVLKVEDEYSNALQPETIKIEAVLPTDESALFVESPKGGKIFGLGQDIDFIVSIINREILEHNPKVILESNDQILSVFELDAKNQRFTTTYKVPKNYSNDAINFKIKLSILKGNEEIELIEKRTISLISKEFLIKNLSGEEKKVKMQLFYPDGETLVDVDSFNAEIIINKKSEKVIFEKKEDVFEAKLETPLSTGEHKVEIKLGSEFGKEKANGKIVIPPNYLLTGITALIVILIIGGIIFGIRAVVSDVKKYAAKRQQLIEEKNYLENHIEFIRHEFYNGRIAKETFQKDLADTQKKLDEINQKLGENNNGKVVKKEEKPKKSSIKEMSDKIRSELPNEKEESPTEEKKLLTLERLVKKAETPEKKEEIEKPEPLTPKEEKKAQNLIKSLEHLKGKYGYEKIKSSLVTNDTNPKILKKVLFELFKK